uniref:Uncharacterized protein n=1 Tax=Arion vulgaris TaxID=1028688 RepID=A0A0B7B2R3_9EUPU
MSSSPNITVNIHKSDKFDWFQREQNHFYLTQAEQMRRGQMVLLKEETQVDDRKANQSMKPQKT